MHTQLPWTEADQRGSSCSKVLSPASADPNCVLHKSALQFLPGQFLRTPLCTLPAVCSLSCQCPGISLRTAGLLPRMLSDCREAERAPRKGPHNSSVMEGRVLRVALGDRALQRVGRTTGPRAYTPLEPLNTKRLKSYAWSFVLLFIIPC